ncbi:hypothetical protein MSPP1_002961 [Malassezia sp. CBS 17886]|nr:hypothetical protein MSPP1_002961 [Malassezia sp. CBS 17886]
MPPTPPPRSARVVRGTVTPSRASRFFLPQDARDLPATPERHAVCTVSCSTPFLASPSPAPASSSSPVHTPEKYPAPHDVGFVPVSPTLMRKRARPADTASLEPARLGARHIGENEPYAADTRLRRTAMSPHAAGTLPPCTALWAMRTRTAPRGFHRRLPASHGWPASYVSAHRYLRAFATDPDYAYRLESDCLPFASAAPLVATYMHGARAATDAPQSLAVGDDEGRVHLLDTSVPPHALSHDACVLRTKALVEGSIFALEWRFDDRVLAVGGSDYSVSAWDIERELCVAKYDAHEGSVRALAWDPHGAGRLLASGGRDGAICMWDLRCAEAVLRVPHAHGRHTAPRRRTPHRMAAGITSLTHVVHGATLASTCSDNAVVKVWDLRMGGGKHGRAPHPVHTTPDLSMQHAHRNTRPAPGPWARCEEHPFRNTRPHGVSSVVAAATRMYAACTDGCVYVLDTADLDRASRVNTGSSHALYHAVQRQNTLYARMSLYNDRFLALGCNSGDVVLWDVAAARVRPDVVSTDAVVLPRAHETNVEVNAVSWATGPDGPTLASVSDDQTIRTWHATSAGEMGAARRAQ